MMSASTIEIYGLIVVSFLLTLVLVRLLFHVRKQARQFDELRQKIDLINKAREEK